MKAAIIMAWIAMLALCLQPVAVIAQGAPPPPGTVMKGPLPLPALGGACKRRTDDRAGIAKRDACGRYYCGRTDVKDIIEIEPDFAARHACAWTLVGDHCKCKRNMSLPKQ